MGDSSADDISYARYMGKLTVDILFYYGVVVCWPGVFFNLISIVVFSRKKFADMSMGFYNIAVGCSNIILLGIVIWYYQPLYFNKNPQLGSQAECVLSNYLQRVFTRFSVWLDTMITVDRMICIMYPTKFVFLKNKKILAALIGALLIVSLLITSQFFQYQLTRTPTNVTNQQNITVTTIVSTCSADSPSTLLSTTIITIFSRVIIPFVIMIVTNSFLIYQLKKVKRERWMQREEVFARTVVALSVFFFVTHVPFSVMISIQVVLSYTDLNPYSRANTITNFVYGLSLIFTSVNYVFPLFINLVFNKLFRAEFCALFRIKASSRSSTLS